MCEDIKRQHRACFTGHRPHKLHQPESVVIAALEEKIREAIDDGFITFISGMAWGVDIWAAEIVLRLKAEGHPIHLVAAVPYEGFERGWDDEQATKYDDPEVENAPANRIKCLKKPWKNTPIPAGRDTAPSSLSRSTP